MNQSLYHNIICDNRASYPIRDSPLKLHHVRMTDIVPYSRKKLDKNDISELKEYFYGGKTHADCYFCEETHHPRR